MTLNNPAGGGSYKYPKVTNNPKSKSEVAHLIWTGILTKDTAWKCPMCDETFPSFKKMKAHKIKVHSY